MFQILILTFFSLAHQQTPKFNFSQFNDSLKMKQIDYLTKFIDLEKSMNLTTQQAQENANFALELWVNTENFLNQSTQQIHNQSILNIINNEQFQNIIPQDQEGMQATEKYIEQWQNQTDVDKSIILQYVIENINEMIQSEDPSNYNQTNLIERISNQTLILDQNKQNINTSKYIFPIAWYNQMKLFITITCKCQLRRNDLGKFLLQYITLKSNSLRRIRQIISRRNCFFNKCF